MGQPSPTMLPLRIRIARVLAPRNVRVSAQRFELAALRVDIAPHVVRNSPKSRVAMERQPQRIVLQGIPPVGVGP